MEDVRLVLKAASDMLAELSTGHNPKNYANLYAEVFTHLQQLPVCQNSLYWHFLTLRSSAQSARVQSGGVIPAVFLSRLRQSRPRHVR